MSYNLVEIDPISGEHKLKKVAGLSKLNVWTGTQADYNAQKNTIPNGSYVNITDDAESGNGIKDIYSTDEVKTNKVWIDGKPIYRKVISTNTPTTTNQWVFITEIISNNINNFIKVEGICSINTSYVPLPYGEIGSQISIVATDGKVRCNVTNTTYLNKPCIIIVEYTKTS